jgi:hypothetical protein
MPSFAAAVQAESPKAQGGEYAMGRHAVAAHVRSHRRSNSKSGSLM